MDDRNDKQVITLETADGTLELAYRDHGTGEPLLLVHGFFGEGRDFLHLLGLGAGMRAVAPDLRGHGHSTNPSSRFRFHDAARDVLELLRRLGIERCRAVGLSGGALTLLRTALLSPGAITSMILVSACDGFPEEARSFMAAYASDEAERAALPELRTRHARGDAQIAALFDAARQFARGEDDTHVSAAELASIRARTLIVTGDRDPLYPLDVALRLFRTLPNAALWVMPDAAHTPVFGASGEEFVARARRFFTDSV
jgi:pimeloyl-ACP methyl ester carboxylesterase